jgi:hypothetical protein
VNKEASPCNYTRSAFRSTLLVRRASDKALTSSTRGAIGKVSSMVSASAGTVAGISSAAKRSRGCRAGKCLLRHCACPRPVYAGTGSAYRKLSTRMTSLLSASTCVYRIVPLSGATANPGACLAGRSSRSNTRAALWVVVLKKVIPGLAVVSR